MSASTGGADVGEVQRAKVAVAIGYEQRADAAAAAVLRRLAEVVADNRPGAVAGDDSEFLHQLRIAVRRSRTVQRQFKGVFPGLELRGFRSDFRWLQRATGDARDLDVHVEEFEDLAALVPAALRDDLEPLHSILSVRRAAAHERLVETLRGPRLRDLLSDWERLLESLVELSLEDRPDARRSIGSLTGERVVAVYERIVEMGGQIEPDGPAEPYHALRKKGKELRYLLELFAAPLFDADAVDPFVRDLKALQEVLGRHQDREVQIGLIRSLVDEVAAAPKGPAACLAMGALVERLAIDERAARDEFAEHFATLSCAEQQARVHDVFVLPRGG